MVAYLDDHPDVAIAGPHTLNVTGTTQSTRRRFPTLATAVFESTWLATVRAETRLIITMPAI